MAKPHHELLISTQDRFYALNKAGPRTKITSGADIKWPVARLIPSNTAVRNAEKMNLSNSAVAF